MGTPHLSTVQGGSSAERDQAATLRLVTTPMAPHRGGATIGGFPFAIEFWTYAQWDRDACRPDPATVIHVSGLGFCLIRPETDAV